MPRWPRSEQRARLEQAAKEAEAQLDRLIAEEMKRIHNILVNEAPEPVDEADFDPPVEHADEPDPLGMGDLAWYAEDHDIEKAEEQPPLPQGIVTIYFRDDVPPFTFKGNNDDISYDFDEGVFTVEDEDSEQMFSAPIDIIHHITATVEAK